MAEAIRRLKVKPEQLATAPQITPLFKKADGGLKTVLGAMRFFAQDEVIAAFLKKYDSIPAGDRENVPWEAVAIAAKLDIHHLVGSILLAIQATSMNAVNVIVRTGQHKIARARLRYGQLPSGERDRTAIEIATGWLPSPKGPTFVGKQVAVFNGQKDAEERAQTVFTPDDDPEQLFPPSNAMQERLVPIRLLER